MLEWNDLHGALAACGLQHTAARLPSAKFIRLTSFLFCLTRRNSICAGVPGCSVLRLIFDIEDRRWQITSMNQ